MEKGVNNTDPRLAAWVNETRPEAIELNMDFGLVEFSDWVEVGEDPDFDDERTLECAYGSLWQFGKCFRYAGVTDAGLFAHYSPAFRQNLAKAGLKEVVSRMRASSETLSNRLPRLNNVQIEVEDGDCNFVTQAVTALDQAHLAITTAGQILSGAEKEKVVVRFLEARAAKSNFEKVLRSLDESHLLVAVADLAMERDLAQVPITQRQWWLYWDAETMLARKDAEFERWVLSRKK